MQPHIKQLHHKVLPSWGTKTLQREKSQSVSFPYRQRLYQTYFHSPWKAHEDTLYVKIDPLGISQETRQTHVT